MLPKLKDSIVQFIRALRNRGLSDIFDIVNVRQSMEGTRIKKVEASAGSGKTYNLTFEYLKILFNNLKKTKVFNSSEPFKTILAITFTNKAVNEMKERIFGKLKTFSMGINKISEKDKEFLVKLSKETGLNRGEIVELSKKVLEVILYYYTDFNVKTIDSLMSSIVKVISHELSLEPDFEIGVDSSEKLNEALFTFIDGYKGEKWEEFSRFLEDFFKIEPLTTWTPETKIVNRIKALYNTKLKKEIEIKEPDTEELKEKINNLRNELKKHLNSSSELYTLIESDLNSRNGYLDRKKILKDTPRRKGTLTRFREFAEEEKESTDFNDVETLLSMTFFRIDNPLYFIKHDDDKFQKKFFKAFEEVKNIFSELIYTISMFKVLSFIKIFNSFNSYFIKEVGKKEIYVEELSKRITEKIEEWQKEDIGPSYLYLKLSEKFLHYLIDEFQDTSQLQFKALAPLIDEILSRERNSTLFIVGDRKQAIYRWRGGMAELMDSLENFISSLKNIHAKELNLTLKNNYRSGKSIVEFNNKFFSEENLKSLVSKKEVYEKIIENFKNSTQIAKRDSEGYVEIRFIEKNPDGEDEEELFELTRESIKKALKLGFKPEDISILVRRNSEGREIIENLSDEFSFVSDESLYISSSPHIMEIISFLRFLEFPPDNLSFFTFINGEIFKKISRTIDNEESRRLNLQLEKIWLDNKEKKLYKLFRDEFPNLWNNLIDPFFKSVGFLPVYDLFKDFSMIYRLYEHFKESSVYFMNFSRILHELENDGITSISSFLQLWDEGKLSSESVIIDYLPGKIRVLTIHKAKGLEFPAVILPVKEKKQTRHREDESKNIFIDEDGIYYIKSRYAEVNKKLNKLYSDELAKEYIDELNILYVAMTRAREALFIPVVVFEREHKSSKSKFERFKDFATIFKRASIFQEKSEIHFGEIKKPPSSKHPKKEKMKNFSLEDKKILSKEWKKDFLVFSSKSIVDKSSWEGIRRGNKIHRLLEKIKRVTSKQELENLIDKLSESLSVESEDRENLKNFLSRDEIFNLFSGDIVVLNEQSIIKKTEEGFEEKRIDRLILKDDELIVVDYKTGEEKREEHFAQIKDYMRILNKIYPQKKVRGILLYIDKNDVEEVFA